MKTSGTKPMKNTMRKQSPLKFADIAAALSTPEGRAKYEASRPKGTTKPVEGKPGGAGAAARARAKAKASETSIKVKTQAPKPTATTKAPEGKPSSRPGSSKPKGAFAGAASKAAGIAAKATPMQMKKKC